MTKNLIQFAAGLIFIVIALGVNFTIGVDDDICAVHLALEDNGPLQVEYDLGTIPAGSVQPIEIQIVNKGTTALEVKNLMHSCSCMHVRCDFAALEPGKTGKVAMELHLYDQEMQSSNTLDIQYVRGKSLQSVKLVFNYRSVRLMNIAPDPLMLGRITNGHISFPPLVVTRGSMPIAFSDVAASTTIPGTSVKVHRVNKDEWSISMIQTCPYDSGALTGVVTVIPDVPNRECRSTVDCFGVVTGKVNVIPAAVSLGSIKRDSPSQIRLRIAQNESDSQVINPAAISILDNSHLRPSLLSAEPKGKFIELTVSIQVTEIGVFKQSVVISIGGSERKDRCVVLIRGECVN